MKEFVSPQEYNDTAMMISYEEGDSLSIWDEQGNCWDGRSMSVQEVEQRLYGIEAWSGEKESLLFLYMGPDSKGIIIKTEEESFAGFAEIGADGALTGRNTMEPRVRLWREKILVTREGRGMKASPMVREELERQEKEISELIEENNKNQKLYERQKDLLEEQRRKQREIEEEEQILKEDIRQAEELALCMEKGVSLLEQKLNVVLNDMGADRQILREYPSDEEMERLLSKAGILEQEIREKLKQRITLRQQLCDKRHQEIAGGNLWQ